MDDVLYSKLEIQLRGQCSVKLHVGKCIGLTVSKYQTYWSKSSTQANNEVYLLYVFCSPTTRPYSWYIYVYWANIVMLWCLKRAWKVLILAKSWRWWRCCFS